MMFKFFKKFLVKNVVTPIKVAAVPEGKKKLEFAYKILANQQTRFRNGSYYAVVKIENIYIQSKTNVTVTVSIKLRKRKDSLPSTSWVNSRKNKLKNMLHQLYSPRLKYLGFVNTVVEVQII
jgi:hypothetical protein